MSPKQPLRPELLAPAGNEECLRAAVSAGADAVYFGLSTGLNARVRAQNVSLEDLPRVLDHLHGHGVKGYVTLNTLVFDQELELAAASIAAVGRAGVDAIIVQDLAVARLARQVCPALPVHASTQMTVGTPDAARVAAHLGITRVVLPRELTLEEVRRFREHTDLELEVFVHGAICMSFSGQCLASEAWGARSANRGLCAQPCRLPYDLVVDGHDTPPKGGDYVLSAQDMAAIELVPELVQAGVACFKIEGRLKDATYVAGTVEQYRRALDAALEGRPLGLDRAARETLAFTFSRGFTRGFLGGTDHQDLVHGETPGHRGQLVGKVEAVRPPRVTVRLDAAAPGLKAGDWVVFDQGRPEEDPPKGGVFAVDPAGRDAVELKFGNPGPDLRSVRVGDLLWKSHDPALERRLRQVAAQARKIGVDLVVEGVAGTPLRVRATDALGRTASAVSEVNLEPARARPLDEAVLRDKLASFGESPFELRQFRVELEGALALPPSELKKVRRVLTASLDRQPVPREERHVNVVSISTVRSGLDVEPLPGPAVLIPLCRTREQVDAAVALGHGELELDFLDLTGLKDAVQACRAAGVQVLLATPRVQKPGEEDFNKRIRAAEPDGILVRHLAGLLQFQAVPAPRLVGDFSLNVTNALSARMLLKEFHLDVVTASNDLNLEQICALARGMPPGRLEVTLHQHLPLFHNQHCLYARHLSDGRDWKSCGRPCDNHDLRLRDRLGMLHPVLTDIGCRNTVFNAQAQSAAVHVTRLKDSGVRRFRVELLRQDAAETRRILGAYAGLLSGLRDARGVLRELGTVVRSGITEGTLQVLAPDVPGR